jgi:hypothetical protein
MDEGEIPSRGYHGMTIRLYDPDADTWSLYWLTSAGHGTIEPPVTGRFADGAGEFLGPDTHDGFPVICRYLWSDIRPASVRWEQALSADDGKTWETNWIMTMTRI